jgi:hypothetical protein
MIKSLAQAICLAPERNLQDILRLLGVWFEYGGNATVAKEIAAAIKIIPLDTWLQAIPQLIARLLVCACAACCDFIDCDMVVDFLVDYRRADPQIVIRSPAGFGPRAPAGFFLFFVFLKACLHGF